MFNPLYTKIVKILKFTGITRGILFIALINQSWFISLFLLLKKFIKINWKNNLIDLRQNYTRYLGAT